MLRAFVQAVRRRIALKLTLTLVGFVGVSLVVAGIYLSYALETLGVEALEARLATAARLLMDEARGLVARSAGPDAVHAFAVRASEPSASRITLIAADGRVLGDSEVPTASLPQVENHAGRPEVRAALAGRVGRDLRHSATIDQPLLYVALPVREGDRIAAVLRLAMPRSAVTASYGAIHRVMLIGGLLALLVAFAIGVFVAGRVTHPVVQMQAIAREMSEGNFAARAPVRSPDEIGVLARALNSLAQRLRDRLEDLQHERAKIAAILDGMVEGVLAVDGRGHVVLMNERARAMFGHATRPEGKPLLEVVRHVGLHELVGQCRLSGEGTVVRRELRVAGLVERTVQANAVPLRLAADDPGVVMMLHDVTELRRLEQVRTEFVANVSHELRTPLTAIQGYLETLLSGALEDREHARRFLEIVFRHTERLGRLLNDLTDLSNIELGRVTLKVEPTRVHDVVESVLAIMKPRAETGGVTLRAELSAGPLSVQADRDRLAQILINLVDNAVKYTPRGGRVTVSARPADGARVILAVEDTGVGIPASDLPRITERFYRVDKARSRELGGTGLGLAIVKHLVAAHGGQLDVESEVDRGTTVRVTLPATEVR